MQNEAEILRQCQSGKLEMFGLLYDSYFKKIYDFIFFRTLHKETAQDLTSQTFFKALDGIVSFNPDRGQFSSWLYKIAKNNVIDYYRSRHQEIDIENIWDLSADDDLRVSIENKERVAKIKEYLNVLKPEQRQIVVMRVWDGMSYAEIAQILGKSEESCKMMFSRVMGKIKSEGVFVSLLIFLLSRTLK